MLLQLSKSSLQPLLALLRFDSCSFQFKFKVGIVRFESFKFGVQSDKLFVFLLKNGQDLHILMGLLILLLLEAQGHQLLEAGVFFLQEGLDLVQNSLLIV